MPKEKLTLYLEPDMKTWLESKTNPELKKSGVVRNIIRDKMNVELRRKAKQTTSTDKDFFSYPNIAPFQNLIPNDLKEYRPLIIEWWAIRYKNKATCSTSVAERIFDKLRSFPTQDRKQALENAIAGGWRDLFPVNRSKIAEEPKNNHPASRVFTAKGGFQ